MHDAFYPFICPKNSTFRAFLFCTCFTDLYGNCFATHRRKSVMLKNEHHFVLPYMYRTPHLGKLNRYGSAHGILVLIGHAQI